MMKRMFICVGALVLLAIGFAPSQNAEAQASFGSNWFAEFYANTDFALPLVSSTNYAGGLNLNWAGVPTDGAGQAIPGMPADSFSVIFSTTENFITTGVYEFSGEVDDRLLVLVDGAPAYVQQVPGTFRFQFSITAGARLLQVGLVELTSTAILRLQWQYVGPTGTTAPLIVGPQARVVNVRGLSLRTGPYLGASRIAVLRPDTNYTVTGKSNDESGLFTWYQVIAGEQTGWASGRYLAVEANPANIPDVPSVFQQIDNAEATGVTGVTRSVMNLRRRPSTRSNVITQLAWGTEVSILGRTLQGGLSNWLHVRVATDEEDVFIVGWIYAPYVGINGPIEAVPVR